MGLHFGNLILHVHDVYHSVVLKSLQNLMLVLRFHSGPLKIKFENTQKNSLIFSTISNLPLYVKYLLMTYASLNIALLILKPFFVQPYSCSCSVCVIMYASLCEWICSTCIIVLWFVCIMNNVCVCAYSTVGRSTTSTVTASRLGTSSSRTTPTRPNSSHYPKRRYESLCVCVCVFHYAYGVSLHTSRINHLLYCIWLIVPGWIQSPIIPIV